MTRKFIALPFAAVLLAAAPALAQQVGTALPTVNLNCAAHSACPGLPSVGANDAAQIIL